MPDGFPITAFDSGPAFASKTTVHLSLGATLEISSGTPQHIGALRGTGTVVLDNTDLIFSDGGVTQPTAFNGTVTGNGDIIFDGGTHTFNALNNATGDFIIRSGTAAISPPETLHRWFRFTIQSNRGNVNVTQISELALYGPGGNRCNLNLTQGASANTLNPGQFWTPSYTLGNPTTESAAALFDGQTGTKWCLTQNTPELWNPGSWREVTLRLPDAFMEEVVAYNLCTANDSSERDPVSWRLESSLDGFSWKTVEEQVNFTPPPMQAFFTWYNGGTPLPFTRDRAITPGAGTPKVITDDTVVEVKFGSTLSIIGGQQQVINALRINATEGGGTITRFTPAAGGTLYLTNVSGHPSTWVIPIAFESVDNPANFKQWQVVADGVLLNGYSITYHPATRVLIFNTRGTVLMVK
jgi:hypothetical protein